MIFKIFVSELMYLETSAKSGENVEESFLKCSKTILAKIQTGTSFNKFKVTCILCVVVANRVWGVTI